MLTKITVLVVEDEALLRMNTVDELTGQGLEVVEAANAKEDTGGNVSWREEF